LKYQPRGFERAIERMRSSERKKNEQRAKEEKRKEIAFNPKRTNFKPRNRIYNLELFINEKKVVVPILEGDTIKGILASIARRYALTEENLSEVERVLHEHLSDKLCH